MRIGQTLINYIAKKYADQLPHVHPSVPEDIARYNHVIEQIIWNMGDDEFQKVINMTESEFARFFGERGNGQPK